jgi:hypothetical protein
MSFGMISYVREKQHQRKDCFIPAWVPKASGPLRPDCDTPRLAGASKEFPPSVADFRMRIWQILLGEEFCGLQDHYRYRATSFC